MNPLAWRREHQITLILAAIVGVPFGVLFGYFLHATGSGASGAYPLGMWLRDWEYHPSRFFGWGTFGALAGAAIVYISHLARSI